MKAGSHHRICFIIEGETPNSFYEARTHPLSEHEELWFAAEEDPAHSLVEGMARAGHSDGGEMSVPFGAHPSSVCASEDTPSLRSLYVIHAHAPLFEPKPLRPGFHLLTNYNVNDDACPRTKRSASEFARLAPLNAEQPPTFTDLCARLHPLLATHAPDPDPRASVCIHLDGYGASSSIVLAYSQSERRSLYTFASGAPCQNTYSEVVLSFP